MKKFIHLTLSLVLAFTVGTYLLASHLAGNTTAGDSCRVGWNSRSSCTAGLYFAGPNTTERIGWNS
jgi:hypothetical protein